MHLAQTRSSLPFLASENDKRDGRPDGHWLGHLQHWRDSIYQRMRWALGSDLERQIAEVTDQLLGLDILLKFIRDRHAAAIPTLAECLATRPGQTVRQVAEQIQARSASPILSMVFESSSWHKTSP